MAGEQSTGRLVLASAPRTDGVKIFSATMVGQRNELGESVTAWLAAHPGCRPTELIITQSSDSRFHCISIVLFYSELDTAR
jgi:hypothetical protein